MTKREYLGRLDQLLQNLPTEERKEILYDYEEHFNMAMESGKSEEEVIQGLGPAEFIAKQYKAAQTIRRAEVDRTPRNMVQAVLSIIGLGFFNLVIVLGPFLALCGIFMALFATGIALVVSGFALILGVFGAFTFDSLTAVINNNEALYPAALTMSVSLSAFGVFIFTGSIVLAHAFYNAFVKYLNWNLKIIRGE